MTARNFAIYFNFLNISGEFGKLQLCIRLFRGKEWGKCPHFLPDTVYAPEIIQKIQVEWYFRPTAKNLT